MMRTISLRLLWLTLITYTLVACSTRAANVLHDGGATDSTVDLPGADQKVIVEADAALDDGQTPLPDSTFDQAIADDAGCLPVADDYKQSLNRKVDVLFVVDTGGSMLDERPRVLATAPVFAAAAKKHGLDFQIGFVAISPDPQKPTAPLGVLLGTPSYLDSSVADLKTEMDTRLKLAPSSGQEVGLDAIAAAFSAALTGTINPSSCSACAAPNVCISGGCRGANFGFRRSDASLEVLVFSDEDDGSTTSAAQAVSLLKGLVDPAKGTHVRVHAVVPLTCGTATPKWTSVLTQTGGSASDLCAADYTPAVTTLADRLFGLRDQFFLTRTPSNKHSVIVTVNGSVAGSAFYDAVSNSVTFATAPADGDVVRIRYKICGP
ncbi:MAG: hypothetical protein KC503_11390 [Myxococcales bacterium]|nr:hypothetical protein [Myxococcales bacterium]